MSTEEQPSFRTWCFDGARPAREVDHERWVSITLCSLLARQCAGCAKKEREADDRKRRHIPRSVRAEVLDAPCAYCGDPFATHVDHIIPVSKGGTSDRNNLAPACKSCNMNKLDFTPEEWRDWRESQGRPWPPKSTAQRLREILAEHREAFAEDQ